MANETTSSTLSELYTEIGAEAQFVASEQSIMKNLVRKNLLICLSQLLPMQMMVFQYLN